MARLQSTQWAYRPGLAFPHRHTIPALLVVATVTVIALPASLAPPALVLPAIGLCALAGAAGVAFLAWCYRAERHAQGVTLWDVAGVLAFIGFAAGMLSEAEHALQLVQHAIPIQ